MKWIVFAELALIAATFGLGAYSQASAHSADEAVASAFCYLAGGALIVVTFLTLLGWWGWQVTFRG